MNSAKEPARGDAERHTPLVVDDEETIKLMFEYILVIHYRLLTTT